MLERESDLSELRRERGHPRHRGRLRRQRPRGRPRRSDRGSRRRDGPEADAVVDDALEIDSIDEAEAAFAATSDEEEEEEAAEELAVDPYEGFRSELRGKPGKWYVIHSYAGFEKRVKQNIESRRSSMAMEDFVFEVQVPMEDVVEIKNGQRKLVNRVRIPGYVLVRMDLNEDSWSVVRHTPGVTGFVGNSHNPTPLRFEEAFNMLKSLVQIVEAPTPRPGAAKGEGRVARHPGRDRLRGRRDHHDQGGLVRGPSRHDQRDQAGERQAHRARLALRARDPGRASFDQVTKL